MIKINASLKKARLRPILICGLCYFYHQADRRSSCTAWIALEKERVNKMPFKIKEVVSEDDKEKNMLCGVVNFQTEDCFEFYRGCLSRAECQPNVNELVLYPNVWYNEQWSWWTPCYWQYVRANMCLESAFYNRRKTMVKVQNFFFLFATNLCTLL